LQAILSKSPIIALPIDEIPSDLKEWASTLRHEVRFWIVEKYINDSGEIIYSIPHIDQDQRFISADSAGEFGGNNQGGNLMSKVVRAGLLKVNQRVYFDYGPKRTTQDTFRGANQRRRD